ncbi:MAG TPA: IPT/TIG domain-containing protein [Pyrinomonadaceae bacterium]|nr:IPT/TIG domain-containing protein [Pyrinomonadaceae bacterium]
MPENDQSKPLTTSPHSGDQPTGPHSGGQPSGPHSGGTPTGPHSGGQPSGPHSGGAPSGPHSRSASVSARAKNAKRQKRSLEGPDDGVTPAPAVPPTQRQIAFMGFLYMFIGVILFYLLFKAWPPDPWPTAKVGDVSRNLTDLITFFARYPNLKFDVHTSLDERLIFLVIVAGAIGSYIHSATSFADYVGNRKFASSWIWWYALRPFVGIALALILYFVVRAGLLTGGANEVSPYGVASMAALAGMFSKQATDKLEELFTTLFRPAPGKGDAKRGDKLTAPTISGLLPKEGPSTGGTVVTITGTGLVDKPAVKFGDKSGVVTYENATTIRAVTPPHEPGEVEVVITNPDGQEGSPKERFTYIESAEDEDEEEDEGEDQHTDALTGSVE